MPGTEVAANRLPIHATTRSLHSGFSSPGCGLYGGTFDASPKKDWSIARQSIPGTRTASTREIETLM